MQNILNNTNRKKVELLESIENWYKVRELAKENENIWKDYLYESGEFHKTVYNRERLFYEISNRLKKKTPFLCARLGHTEVRIAGEYLEKCFGMRDGYSDEMKKWLLGTSGFFLEKENHEKEIDRYAQMTLDACENVDILLVYASWKYYTYISNYYCPNAMLTTKTVQPYDRVLKPWFDGLEGKKVLVVSPFSKSVEYQYARKDKICKYPEWELPEFELKTFQMIETQFGHKRGYTNWFEAYDDVTSKIFDIDFDVAIVGAGAYGFPLSSAIRKQGKTVIELCSYTTMMFGIVGQRHINFGFKEQFGTDAWIRPLEAPPEYYKDIEEGAYW